jgi:hypothetical protein
MSVIINNMSGTIFTETPNGITTATSDNSTFAATTAFVKNFISSYLVRLTTPQFLTLPTITLSSIYTTFVSFATSPILRGAISIGKAATVIKILNNTIITDTNYPYILSSENTNSQRIQAGYYTSGVIPAPIVTPKVPAGPANAYATPSASLVCGVHTPTGTGFNVYLGTTTSNEIHWILFQTN